MNPLTNRRTIDLSAPQKRIAIGNRLNQEPIKSDTKFVALMNELIAEDDKNLDAVIEHLNEYRNSMTGVGQAHAQWCSSRTKHWKTPLSVTLTYAYQPRNKVKVEGDYLRFINRLSKACYGMAYRRYKKTILNHAYVEGGGRTRFHIHTTIETPEHKTFRNMKDSIKECWWKHGFVHVVGVDVDEIEMLAGYNTKLKSKSSKNVSNAMQDSFIPA